MEFLFAGDGGGGGGCGGVRRGGGLRVEGGVEFGGEEFEDFCYLGLERSCKAL